MSNVIGVKNPNASIEELGINNTTQQYWNLTPEELIEHGFLNLQVQELIIP